MRHDSNGTPGRTALQHRSIYQEFFRYQRGHAATRSVQEQALSAVVAGVARRGRTGSTFRSPAGADRRVVGLENALLLRVALDDATGVERAAVSNGDQCLLRDVAAVVEDP